MAITQDVIVINEGFQERRRTTSSGTKSRYTITVTAEPIIHNFSAEKLGEGPAIAIREAIVKQIKAITEVANLATIKRRQNAAKAIQAGKTDKRYSGGRMGAIPPSGSVRLFNDSGRLADGIFVRQNPQEKNWTINVPANRLDPSTFKSQGAFVGMVNRLRELVPALVNPFGDKDVAQAILDGIDGVLIRTLDKGKSLKEARDRAFAGLFKQGVSALL